MKVSGTLDDVSDELKAFLDYVAGKRPEASYVEKLEEAVRKARKNREWRNHRSIWAVDWRNRQSI